MGDNPNWRAFLARKPRSGMTQRRNALRGPPEDMRHRPADRTELSGPQVGVGDTSGQLVGRALLSA